MSGSNCCFLTCIQISQEAGRWPGIPISFRIFQFFVIHTVIGFGVVNKAEVDVFSGILLLFLAITLSLALMPYTLKNLN